ncbi:MAG: hypothetical protein HQK77_14860 [Desulfobacterales bacterium]|nr:hypothetical protein [Desulfobacterales bacterium]
MILNNQFAERDTLLSEIDHFAQERQALLKQIQELNLALTQKKRESQNQTEQVEHLKRMIMAYVSEENNIQFERQFLESEKKGLEKSYGEILKRLEVNRLILEDTISDIHFLKSEIGTLKEKMILLEQEIPARFQEADNLGQKVTGTLVNSINDLYNKISVVEKKIKVLYYKKETI